MKAMNILHIVSAKVWGGGEQYAYNVCREQKLRGHKIFVVIDDKRTILSCFNKVGTVLATSLSAFKMFSAAKTIAKFIKEKRLEDIVTIDKYTADINKYYRSFDLYVLPSRNEAFGLVIIEAMACGTPVITTNSGAQQEIITHEKNGIIINPNKDELAKAIENLYNDKELYIKIAREGLETVKKRFTIKTCVDGIHEVYDSLWG